MKLHLMCLFVCSQLFFYSDCAKILGVFPVPGKSHYMAGKTIMQILADAGHEVTVVSPFNEKNPPKNYKSLMLPGVMEAAEKERERFFHFGKQINPFLLKIFMTFAFSEMLENTITNPEFVKLLNSNEKFDLIILEPFFTEGLIFLNWWYKVPIILFSALDASNVVNYNVGNPTFTSYIPNFSFPYSSNMSFWERANNFAFELLNYFLRYSVLVPSQNKIIQKHYPEVPHLEDILYNVSLVFLNSDPSISNPVPKVPNMIDIGGFHINEPKALPSDLQTIFDNSKDGVILFSMGSNLKSVDMPDQMRELFVKSFSTLKETVLWKWELDELPNQPKNVKIKKWLPQQDILAHKNVKLFITHGGIFSTMEAIKYGVPVLAIPVFGDQELNAKKVVQDGYGEMVLLTELEDKFNRTLNLLLTDKKYQENANRKSKVMNDAITKPREKLKFYVDYVLRHKGAFHLQVAGVKLSWYKYYNLDVMVFWFILSLCLAFGATKTLLWTLGYLKNKKSSTKLKTK